MKAGWDRFWFAPTSPLPVCLFRILFGLLALGGALWVAPDLLTWYGRAGTLSLEAARSLKVAPSWTPFGLLLWGGPDSLVIALLVLQIVATLSLIVGYRARASTLVMWWCLETFHVRNPLHGLVMESILRLYGFLLLFAPAGAALSIDSLKKESQDYAPWAQRLMQIQMTLAYWRSFWGKTHGLTWHDGTALYYIVHSANEMRFPVPLVLDHLWAYQAVTYLTLLFELSMCTLIWVKRIRYPLLVVGIAFHLPMQVLFNLDLTELSIMAVYVTFLDPADLKRWLSFAAGYWSRRLRRS